MKKLAEKAAAKATPATAATVAPAAPAARPPATIPAVPDTAAPAAPSAPVVGQATAPSGGMLAMAAHALNPSQASGPGVVQALNIADDIRRKRGLMGQN